MEATQLIGCCIVTKALSSAPTTQCSKQYHHQVQAPQDYLHTRSKSCIYVTKKHFNLFPSVPISPISTTYRRALKDPHWSAAMLEEFDALMNQNTWSFVSKPAGVNVVSGKWISSPNTKQDGWFVV
jgi:hypothetical protein